MFAVEFVTTKQGARSMLYEGYKYTLNRCGNADQTYWRCVNRSCPGRVTLNVQDGISQQETFSSTKSS